MKRRAYRNETDVELLQNFNAHTAAATEGLGYLHPGDIPHHMFNGNRMYDTSEVVTIWEDDHGVAAWVLDGPRHKESDIQVRPDLKGTDFEREVMDFAEAHLLELMNRHGIEGDKIFAVAFQGDDFLRQYLSESGWIHDGNPPWVLNRISLDDLAKAELPEGYIIRAATGIEDAAGLAEVHKASFGVAWTAESYRKVMESPGYAAEREFVVVAPDGNFAAFTVTWHDPANRMGLFEPVGTHSDYRRKGLGKALLLTVLHHMKTLGMEFAEVVNEGTNEGSRSLYLSCGFRPWHHIDNYEKPISS
jgi:mycothiol synthase